MNFDLVVCGGTFDYFHLGHRALLRMALSIGNKVIIGITSDEYIKNLKSRAKNTGFIESYEKRKAAVLSFLKQEQVFEKTEVIKIDNLYGPTLDKNLLLDAIVVSEGTIEGAKIINKARLEKGLPSLKVIVQPMVLGEDKKEVSSFRIRGGEVNRDGRLNINPLWLKNKLLLTDKLRVFLKKPLGILVKGLEKINYENCPYIVTVGDVTTKAFNSFPKKPDISVVDFKVSRRKKFQDIRDLSFKGDEEIISISSPPGCLTSSIFITVISLFKTSKRRVILKIEGEDDLSVLPLILAAPLGSIVLYGQPNEGIVVVEVSERNKEKAYEIINKFDIRGV